MKQLLFLIAALVAVSTTAMATTTTGNAETSTANGISGYGNSFIFIEGGIEFAVFPDGQFDFYAQTFGPNLNVGIQNRAIAFSFNTGFNYNPWVQYDGFGAVIQVENTPIFYDAFGRVAQIGTIVINYNSFGRVHRIGGLHLFWNGNVFVRHRGFINRYNSAYVYRPWHQFYAIPPANFCLVNARPYRRYYSPVRNVWYRPYRNNVRYFNSNRRNANTNFGRRYAQIPRNNRERNLGRRVQERHQTIERGRRTRLATTTTPIRRNATAANARNSTPNRTRRLTQAPKTRMNTRERQHNTSTLNHNTPRSTSNVRTHVQPNRNYRVSSANSKTRVSSNRSTSSVNRGSRTAVRANNNTVTRNRNTTSVRQRNTTTRNINNRGLRSNTRSRRR